MTTSLTRRDAGDEIPAPLADLSFTDMLRLGDLLVTTGFLPAHIRTGAQAVAIMLAGRELGIPLMRALRSFSMVKGKVTEGADSQLARFKAAGGRASFLVLDATEATIKLAHPNGDEHTETFTIQDAQAAGLTSSDMYKKYPKAMLRSRVITAGLKSLGWDGAVGVYDPAELADAPAQPVAAQDIPRQLERPETVDADGVDLSESQGEAFEDDVVTVALDVALDMTVNKQVLGNARNSGLRKIKEWALGKIDTTGDDSGRLATIVAACDAILDARARGEIQEPAKQEAA